MPAAPRLAVVGLACALVTACGPAGTPPSPSPTTSGPTASPSASAPPTTTPTTGFIAPEEAERILSALARTAGSDTLIKVTLDQATAEIVAVVDGSAQTWAWREGRGELVDGDTRYLGQSTFALDDFRLDSIPDLFAQAARISGSDENQQLQIVEYAGSDVYLIVTTVPESIPVFFRPDATLVPRLDFALEAGLRTGFYDVTWGRPGIIAMGYDPAEGVWADRPGGGDVITRSIRDDRFPVRRQTRQAETWLRPFDPDLVRPDIVTRVMASLRRSPDDQVTFVADRREGWAEPTLRFTLGGETVVTDLDGNDITSSVAER